MLTLQKVTVAEVYNNNKEGQLFTVAPDEDFSQVIQHFANHSELRGIFVTDDEKRLLGVITRTDLLDWARAQLGAIFQVPRHNQDKTLRLLNLMRASTAGQVMHKDSHRAAIKTDQTLTQALKLMIELDLIILPVVDEINRLIGDIRLSELLAHTVKQEGAKKTWGIKETRHQN